MWSYFLVLASSRVISGIMYRTSPVIVENKPLQGEARHLRCLSVFALSGLIFPIMTAVLYIIPYLYHGLGEYSILIGCRVCIRFLLRHEGAYFSIMTGEVLYIIPLITRLLPKTKQFIYNVFVTSIHSVDQQRNSPPKTLTSSLSNRQRLGWYISRLLHWQVTGLRAEWYQRQKVLLFTLTAVIIHPLPMNYPKIIDRRKLWSAHASERNVEKTRVIINNNL